MTPKQELEIANQQIAEQLEELHNLERKIDRLEEQLKEAGCSLFHPLSSKFEVINDKADDLQSKLQSILSYLKVNYPEIYKNLDSSWK